VPQFLRHFASNEVLIVSLSTFAVAGLVIAMVGLYGVMSQLMQQRRREIGVRIALGATHESVILMMLGRGGRLIGVGIVVGTAFAFAATVFLHRAMPMLPTLGWVGQGLIAFALGFAGMVACYLPSRHAVRIDPIEVLRSE